MPTISHVWKRQSCPPPPSQHRGGGSHGFNDRARARPQRHQCCGAERVASREEGQWHQPQGICQVVGRGCEYGQAFARQEVLAGLNLKGQVITQIGGVQESNDGNDRCGAKPRQQECTVHARPSLEVCGAHLNRGRTKAPPARRRSIGRFNVLPVGRLRTLLYRHDRPGPNPPALKTGPSCKWAPVLRPSDNRTLKRPQLSDVERRMDQRAIVMVCSTDRQYVRPLATMLVWRWRTSSLLGVSEVHIIYDDVPEAERCLFARWLGAGAVSLFWHHADRSRFVGMPYGVPYSVYDKLLVPDLLPADCGQALWLDGDTLVLGNIAPLWDRGAGCHAVLAVQDPTVPRVSSQFGVAGYRELGLVDRAPYFNAGVMLMNLARWRREEVSARALDYLKKYREQCDVPRAGRAERGAGRRVGRAGSNLEPKRGNRPPPRGAGDQSARNYRTFQRQPEALDLRWTEMATTAGSLRVRRPHRFDRRSARRRARVRRCSGPRNTPRSGGCCTPSSSPRPGSR